MTATPAAEGKRKKNEHAVRRSHFMNVQPFFQSEENNKKKTRKDNNLIFTVLNVVFST